HGQARVDHRTELTGGLEAAAVPATVEAQCIDHVVRARAGEAGRAGTRHRAGIRRQAVDVGSRQPRVRDRGEARVERELQRIAAEATPDVGLPRARDARAPFDDLIGVHHQELSGSNRGMYTSPSASGWCSNLTRTFMPTNTSSIAQFTMFVVSRSAACSGI